MEEWAARTSRHAPAQAGLAGLHSQITSLHTCRPHLGCAPSCPQPMQVLGQPRVAPWPPGSPVHSGPSHVTYRPRMGYRGLPRPFAHTSPTPVRLVHPQSSVALGPSVLAWLLAPPPEGWGQDPPQGPAGPASAVLLESHSPGIPDTSECQPGLRARALDVRAFQEASLECTVKEARARVQMS